MHEKHSAIVHDTIYQQDKSLGPSDHMFVCDMS